MTIADFIIAISLGLSIGFLFGEFIMYMSLRKSSKNKSVGILRVDQSDELDNPYLFLELNDPKAVDKIMKRNQVVFDVVVKNYVTQK